MGYEPKPVDTSRVSLTDQLVELTNRLAEHAHDVWAKQRLSDGWRYGPTRDDTQKTHPCLVPYNELPEAEKVYDRKIAVETLKVVQAFGFRVLDPKSPTSLASGEEVAQTVHRLSSKPRLGVVGLQAIWRGRSKDTWRSSPDVYTSLGEQLRKVGAPLLAYDVLSEGLEVFEDGASSNAIREAWPEVFVRLRQVLALVLADTGATHRANRILQELRDSGQDDGETLGILARTYKDLWRHSSDTVESADYLQRSFETYHLAYSLAIEHGRVTDAYYNGINAATLSLLRDQEKVAHGLAVHVKQLCQAQKEPPGEDSDERYWVAATQGEAELILGDLAEAARWYTEAGNIGRGRLADLSATRRQARRVLAKRGDDVHRLDSCFGVPNVAVFSGHMVDRPSRKESRFPPELEGHVRKRIEQFLEDKNVRIGYASAANGSDILFLEALLDRRGEINIVLPFPAAEFRKKSVDTVSGADWGTRFDRLIKKAARVYTLGEYSKVDNSVSYGYANLFQDGVAALRAEVLDAALCPLAVWDGKPGDGPYGTASMVEHWQKQDRSVDIVIPSDVPPEKAVSATYPSMTRSDKSPATGGTGKRIMAMLFADTVAYSKLADDAIPHYLDQFCGAVAELVRASSSPPVYANTWGDAFYFVFPNVADAGRFGLQLRDLVCQSDWSKKRLPKELSLRIALHVGPVHVAHDPVKDEVTYTGSHTSRAARIEPITPPGQVYASEAFAALASAEGVKQFACEYVGLTELAKRYGVFPTYRLRGCNDAK